MLLLAGLLAAPAGAEPGTEARLLQRENFSVNCETRQYDEDVTGGQAASPRSNGDWHAENLTIDYDCALPGGTRVQSSLQAQETDDDRVNRRPVSIERFFLMVEGEQRCKLTLGDYFVNFSPYVLARSAEGADLALRHVRDDIGDIEWLTTYGKVNGADNGVQFARWLAGSRVGVRDIRRARGGFVRQCDAGLNFSRAWDDPGSVAYTGGAIRENRGTVGSLDMKLLTDWDLEWTGEVARAKYWPDQQTNLASQSGNAHKLTVARRTGLVNFTAEHEYVSPRFTTMTGAASPDARRWNLNLNSSPRSGLNLRGSAGTTANNVTGQSEYTTTSTNLAGGATWVPLAEARPDLTFDADVRDRRVKTDTAVTNRVTNAVDFSVRDNLWDCPVNLAYGWEKSRDYINPANNSRTMTWGAGISRAVNFGQWQFRPSINYSHSRDWYPAAPVSAGATTTRYALTVARENLGMLGLSYQYQNSGRSDGTSGLRRDLVGFDVALTRWQEHNLKFNLQGTSSRNRDRVGAGTFREDRLELRAQTWF